MSRGSDDERAQNEVDDSRRPRSPRTRRTAKKGGNNQRRRQRPSTPRSDGGRPSDDRETWGQTLSTLAREIVVTALVIGVIVALLFGISGVWPPMVAVESDSMEPNIMTGDLVFIIDTDRFVGDGAIEGTGVVPVEAGANTGYEKFDESGDVIVFAPDGDHDTTPIIHRAHLWVEEGEDWSDQADDRFVTGNPTCDEMDNCPAPHSGFITHGDNNQYYDQLIGQSEPVKADWILAKAEIRVPFLGRIRLLVSQVLFLTAITIGPIAGILAGRAGRSYRSKRD